MEERCGKERLLNRSSRRRCRSYVDRPDLLTNSLLAHPNHHFTPEHEQLLSIDPKLAIFSQRIQPFLIRRSFTQTSLTSILLERTTSGRFDFSTLPAARTREPASSTTAPTGGAVNVLVRLASESSSVDAALITPLGRLASSLRSIDQLDRRSRCLTVANNWAYYEVRTVYRAFCMVSRPLGPVFSTLVLFNNL